MTETAPDAAPRAAAASPAPASAATFTTHSPATGERLAEYPVHGPEDVARVVARARTTQTGWAELPASRRRELLLRWKKAIAENLDTVARTVARETGKPVGDAELEVVLTLEHLAWAARNARRVLGRRGVRTGLFTVHQRASLVHRPLGVIGVIGPWNYPLYTPMGSVGYALAAGNAVVFKPSELTPGTGVLLAELFDATAPEHAGLLTTVTGAAATGDALARSGVDKVAFTGSPGTARKVMAVCTETLTPFLAECGGKDAVIVTADADLEAAADAIVWGALSNAGQTCAGVERVYAVREVHEELCEKVVEKARALRTGADADAAYGPMTLPGQVAVVERHVSGAVAAGGRGAAGRAGLRARAVRGARGADRRAGGRAGDDGGDVRAGGDRQRGGERGRGRGAGQRLPIRPRRGGVQRQRAHRCGDRGAAARGRGVGELGAGVRGGARAAVRRFEGLRVRADPRRGGAAGVHLRAVGDGAAIRPGDRADLLLGPGGHP